MRAKSSTAITQRQTRCIFETESDHPWPVSDDKGRLGLSKAIRDSKLSRKAGFQMAISDSRAFFEVAS
jgi:hypothetical protein